MSQQSNLPPIGTRAVQKGTPAGSGPIKEVYQTLPKDQSGTDHDTVVMSNADHKLNRLQGHVPGEGRLAIPLEQYRTDYREI